MSTYVAAAAPSLLATLACARNVSGAVGSLGCPGFCTGGSIVNRIRAALMRRDIQNSPQSQRGHEMSWYAVVYRSTIQAKPPHVWPVHAIVVWCRGNTCMFVARLLIFACPRFIGSSDSILVSESISSGTTPAAGPVVHVLRHRLRHPGR